MLKIIQKHCPDTEFPDTGHLFPEKCFFFDIETTGFSKEKNMIYLIGTAHCEENKTIITQFFAEDGQEDEAALLDAFFKFCTEFEYCITFNGIAFDIPFVQKRASLYQMNHTLTSTKYLDLYREICNFSALLPVANLKQKSVEQFLGISRDDKYTGGELIEIYKRFLKSKEGSDRQLLLLHNYEDVLGMVPVLNMLNYKQALNAEYNITAFHIHKFFQFDGTPAQELSVQAVLPRQLPAGLFYKNDYLACKLNGNQMQLAIPLFCGCKKLFFKDYKNYYYLPEEDKAIHKSVACFVQNSHRQKAKASNCYQKHNGLFLHCPDILFRHGKDAAFAGIPDNIVKMLRKEFPVFKDGYTDKGGYILWNEGNDCPENEALEWLLKLYISTFLTQSNDKKS